MSATRPGGGKKNTPQLYQIRVKGHLDEHGSDWSGGLSMTAQSNGETLLRGLLTDQAALHGLLRRAPELRLQLRVVTRIEQDQAEQVMRGEEE